MAVATEACRDRVIPDQWRPRWAIDETEPGVVRETRLLGESVSLATTAENRAAVRRTRRGLTTRMTVDPASITDTLPSKCEFLYVLPLDPRAETPIRSDRSSIAYRRWLSDLGVTYGVIGAA